MRPREILAFLILLFGGPLVAMALFAAVTQQYPGGGSMVVGVGVAACGWALWVMSQHQP